MDDALRRAGWICIAAIAGAYLTFLGTDRVFHQQSATTTPIFLRDILRKGEHHLYGKIVIPASCDDLNMKVQNVDESHYQLMFTTWEEPSVKCVHAPVERLFDTIVFAPTVGVEFSATLDKEPVPVVVYPVVSNQ